MMIDLAIIALVMVAAVTLFASVLARRLYRTRQEIGSVKKQLDALQSDMKALYLGAAGAGSRLARLEARLSQLSERHDKISEVDVSLQSYGQAIDLVHQGAEVEELIGRCGLMREEAELLVRLHANDEVPGSERSYS